MERLDDEADPALWPAADGCLMDWRREVVLATRVFELARELGVTSKDILAKCRAEGLELKNHMTTLSAGLEATIREWFSEGQSLTAVEVAEHVDLDTARAKAHRQRSRAKPAAPEAPAEIPVEPSPAEPAVAQEPVAAPLAEVEASAAPPVAAGPEAPTAPAGQAPVELAAQAAAPTEASPSAAAPQVGQAPPEPPAAAEPPRARVKPAGPQLVPKPAEIKGPRVVRVERAETVSRYPRRPVPAPAGSLPLAPPAGGRRGGRIGEIVGTDEEEAARRKGVKRRTPRRRSDSPVEAGDHLREWRDKDLAERSQRLAAATGGTLRHHRATVAQRHETAVRAGPVEVEEPITIKSLAAASGIKAATIIRKLMDQGTVATINQGLDRQSAELLLLGFGMELSVKRAKSPEEQLLEKLSQRPQGSPATRAPVVTFLGHVDHGKTSLLDRIRHTAVAAGEAGGITQHMGAYRFDRGASHVVFLDTPGHEAFTAMRSRGANMTDVVVLVVAADDGVMPQTIEAINHARAANVPIVVALNKVDVPNANINRALGQLAEHGLQPREWGGTTEVIQTSAVTGQGIDELVETLSLEAELLELKAETDAPAWGFVIESNMDPGLGPIARVLVRNGTLKVGDIVLAGRSLGRVRSMTDDKGRPANQAAASFAVEVAGLDEVVEAGDKFYVVDDIEQARAVAMERRQQDRAQALTAGRPGVSLDDLLARITAGRANELALIVRADVQGTLEALLASLERLGTAEVRLKILHGAVGGISTGDVTLAEASGAIIAGFNVVPDAAARHLAEQKGVDIRLYRVIYDLIDDVRKALSEGLAPEIRLEVLGHAEVRQTFKISRLGTVAGCHVTDGTIYRNAKLRLVRNNVVVEDERSIESLKRFKDDAREVRSGLECGIKIAGYDDVKEGDVLEAYRQVEVARKL
jgi:translation initiation factor IF-2